MAAQMGMERIHQLVRAGLPFNPFSGEEIVGANLDRLRASIKAFGWTDPRFISRAEASRHGWQIDPKATGVQLLHRNSSNGTMESTELFNAANVTGMPLLPDFLALSDQDLEAFRGGVEEPVEELRIGPAGRQLNRTTAEAGLPPPAVAAEATPAPGKASSDRYVVGAPYWLDGMHNFTGLTMARELNELIQKAGITRDQEAMKRLLSGRDRAAMYELKVISEEEHLQDADFVRNLAEPEFLLNGELVRDKHGAYRPNGGGKEVLLDQGESLVIKSKSGQAYEAAIELAKAKGWTAIELSGNGKMLANAWLEAKMTNIEVVNYKPTLEDEKRLAERMALENAKKVAQESPEAAPEAAKQEPAPEVVEVHPYTDHDGHEKTAKIVYTVTQEGRDNQEFHDPADAAKAFAKAPAKNMPAVFRSVVRDGNGEVTTEAVADVSQTKERGKDKLAKIVNAKVDQVFHQAYTNIQEAEKEAKKKEPAKTGPASPQMFSGKILRIEGDAVIQKIGRGANDIKSHPISKLDRVPDIGEVVDISYGKDGKAIMSGKAAEVER